VARAEAMVFRAKAKAKAGEDHKEDKGGKDKGGKDDKEDKEGKDKGETGEAQCKGEPILVQAYLPRRMVPVPMFPSRPPMWTVEGANQILQTSRFRTTFMEETIRSPHYYHWCRESKNPSTEMDNYVKWVEKNFTVDAATKALNPKVDPPALPANRPTLC